MKQKFLGWPEVARHLRDMARPSFEFAPLLNDGQRASLESLAERLPHNGVIIADEVGMGKTRIATALTRAVLEAKGRVAIIVPPGLGFQWGDELRKTGIPNVPGLLRSLDAYLNAWDRDKDEYKPWAEYPVLIISQAFCNWQVKSTTRKNWKWTLLPQTLALVQARLRGSGRMPRGTRANERFDDERIAAAATWIAGNAVRERLNALAKNDELSQWGHDSPLFNPGNYLKQTEFRKGLECVVGLGLGEFDLLVVDEAHKSRGEESNLNRLLKHVVISSRASRRLALTATPIELDVSQWKSTLKRIGASDKQRVKIVAETERYAQAIRNLRLGWRTSAPVRDEYRKAAAQFHGALSPYLLRRDKREDEDVRAFADASGQFKYDYRLPRKIEVKLEDLCPIWRHAVCAAEALSVARETAMARRTKRLRLTIGNGHGLASVIDEAFRNDKEDKKQLEDERKRVKEEQGTSGSDEHTKPQLADRSKWWACTLQKALAYDPHILFDHPAILAAVSAIEEDVARGEKVLVFGRFTEPMRALVKLLNAREMLKAVEAGRPWPQSKVNGDRGGPEPGEWPAVCAAHRQLSSKVDLAELDGCLTRRYGRESDRRTKQREELLPRLRDGLSGSAADSRYIAILNAIERRLAPVTGDNEPPLVLLARAIAANTDHPDEPAHLASAFRTLVAAAGDHDSDEENEVDKEQAEEIWDTLEKLLWEAYSSQQGGFARLMYGETKPSARRMLQFAFNRPKSFPHVLVAQSLVGREGLNLHESCRIVVLLHPEWNPGAVEQQIGRVDRVNSRWVKELRKAIADGKTGADLPHIEIRPVIFKGTYDEHNWTVLQERRDDLRAQLHGEVIPNRLRASEDEKGRAILDDIAKARPDFSPHKN